MYILRTHSLTHGRVLFSFKTYHRFKKCAYATDEKAFFDTSDIFYMVINFLIRKVAPFTYINCSLLQSLYSKAIVCTMYILI